MYLFIYQIYTIHLSSDSLDGEQIKTIINPYHTLKKPTTPLEISDHTQYSYTHTKWVSTTNILAAMPSKYFKGSFKLFT